MTGHKSSTTTKLARKIVSLSIASVSLMLLFALVSQTQLFDRMIALAQSPPTADAGPDQTVDEGDTVFLDGSGSSSNAEPPETLTFSWTQTQGPDVSLSGADTDSPSFVAPDVSITETLTFLLTVGDSEGEVADEVDVFVEPIPAQLAFVGVPNELSELLWNYGGTIPGAVVNEDNDNDPVEGVTVEIVLAESPGADSAASTTTDEFGDFELDFVASQDVGDSSVQIRAFGPGYIEVVKDITVPIGMHSGHLEFDLVPSNEWGHVSTAEVAYMDDDAEDAEVLLDDTPSDISIEIIDGTAVALAHCGTLATCEAVTASTAEVDFVTSTNVGTGETIIASAQDTRPIPLYASLDGTESESTTTMEVEAHDGHVEFSTGPVSNKWGFDTTFDVTYVDDDAATAAYTVPTEPEGVDISITGGTAVDEAFCGTASYCEATTSSDIPITFVTSQDVGTSRTIEATSTATELLKSGTGSTNMDVDVHDTATVHLTPAASAKWYFPFDVIVNVLDDDADGVDAYTADPEPDGLLVTITGDAIDIANSNAPFDGTTTSPVAIPVVASQNTGTGKEVTATTTATLLYKGSFVTNTMAIEEHGLLLLLNDVPDLGWELKRTLGGHVEDVDASGVHSSRTADTPAMPSGLGPITFDGTGVGTNIAVPLTGSLGDFASLGRAPLPPAASGFLVQAHYDGNSALYGPDDSDVETFATLEHNTGIDWNYANEKLNPADPQFLTLFAAPLTTDIESVKKNGRAAVGGTLFDLAFLAEGTLDRIEITRPQTISFSGAGASSLGLPDAGLQGLFFEGDVEIIECDVGSEDCSIDSMIPFGADPDDSSNMLVSLAEGGKIVFGPETFAVQIYLQDIEDTEVEFTVRENNGEERDDSITGAGPADEVITLLEVSSGNTLQGGIPVPHGLTEIEFTNIPNGRLGIGAVVVVAIDGRNPIAKTFALNFENEIESSPSSPFEAHPAAFTSIGTAPNSQANDLEISAEYDGEEGYYVAAADASGFIDIIHDTSGVTSSVAGSVPVSITGSTGTTFPSYPCAVGNDSDEDGVCDTWEAAGVITAGGGSYSFPAGDVPVEGVRDIYVEVDSFSGRMFTEGTFGITGTTGIEDAFDAASSSLGDYELHIIKSDETITEAFPLKVWSDSSSSWVRNSGQTHTVTNPDGTDRIREFTISGISVGTTGAVTGHTLELKVTATFSADPGIITASIVTFPSIGTGKSSAVSSLTAVDGAPVVSGSTVTIPITLTYTTTAAAGIIDTNSEGDLGSTAVRITLPTGKGGVSLNSVSAASGNGIVSNNNDFDGIKRNYFGTAAERGTGDTLAKNDPDLVAKAQVFRYALIARTSGPNTSTCGSSGWAELGGNDMIITLGAKSSANCFTGTNGSTDEQKGTFLHELGHTLGLRHNGNTDDNCAPNYPSVMNYAKQIPIANFGVWRADYSHQDLANLDERAVGLGFNEALDLGLSLSGWPVSTIQIVAGNGAGTSVLITIDGDTVDGTNLNGGGLSNLVGFDINYLSTVRGCDIASPSPSLTVLAGFDDWENLQIPFTSSGVPNDGKPANSNDDINGDPSDPNSVLGSLIIESNDGFLIGTSKAFTQPGVTLEQLQNAHKVKEGQTEVLRFKYNQKDGQPYPGTTDLRLLVVRLADNVAFQPVQPSGVLTTNFAENPTTHEWQYNLKTGLTGLTKGFVYGLQVSRVDADGTSILDVNNDGYFGFINVTK